jgi:hypothetical protein
LLKSTESEIKAENTSEESIGWMDKYK